MYYLTVARLIIPEENERRRPVATNLPFDYAYNRQAKKYGILIIQTLNEKNEVIRSLEKQTYAIFDIDRGISYVTKDPKQGIILKFDYNFDTLTINCAAKFDFSVENKLLLLNSINFVDSLNHAANIRLWLEELNESDTHDLRLEPFPVNDIKTLVESIIIIKTYTGPSIDILGAITLSVTIISFLVALQFTQTISTSTSTVPIVIVFAVAAIISLIFFVRTEKKTDSPLVDLKLLANKVLLPANIINMVVGITALMVVYQTIPILIRSPQPLGFGGDALSIASIQLPYMMISLIVSIASGFIVSRFGNLKPTLIGIVISLAGFILLFGLHSTEFLITMSLALLATGLSLTQIGAINIVLVSTPKQSNGISLAMTVLLYLIGTSVGPIIAGAFCRSLNKILH